MCRNCIAMYLLAKQTYKYQQIHHQQLKDTAAWELVQLLKMDLDDETQIKRKYAI